MNSDSKTNLLKILLNEPNENPYANRGEWENTYTSSFTPPNTALTEDQLQFQGYTIGLCGDIGSHGGRVLLFDSEGNKLLDKKPILNGQEISVTALCMDENGEVYGLGVEDNFLVLLYFNNIFVKTAAGTYDVVIKKSYSLQSEFQAIYNEYGGSSTLFVSDIKKSPYSSQFVISQAYKTTNSNYSLITMLYNVNVGSDNTYDYKLVYLNDYPADYAWIKNITPNWANNACSFKMLLDSRPTEWSSMFSKFYYVTGEFGSDSAVSVTKILDIANVVPTDYGYAGYYASKNAVITCLPGDNHEVLYFVVGTKTDSTTERLSVYMYFTEYNYTYEVWHKECVYNTNTNKVGMVEINGELFWWAVIADTASTNKFYIVHRRYDLNHEVYTENEKELDDQISNDTGAVFIIQNYFNLYKMITNSTNYQHFIWYIWKKDGYTGWRYFSNKSVTSDSLRLVDVNDRPLFDRNLYNKIVVGNTINSITQVPFNYLNDTLVWKEYLISENNNVIDTYNQEITKNIYEELYITNIDSFKVWDNNNGSTYNQNSSIEIAKNVYDGFENNYKITKYKINYKNGTSQTGKISYTRTDNEAEISLAVYNTGIDNIELYDDNFTIPFIKIDISDYEINKLYVINQKVKVE